MTNPTLVYMTLTSDPNEVIGVHDLDALLMRFDDLRAEEAYLRDCIAKGRTFIGGKSLATLGVRIWRALPDEPIIEAPQNEPAALLEPMVMDLEAIQQPNPVSNIILTIKRTGEQLVVSVDRAGELVNMLIEGLKPEYLARLEEAIRLINKRA